MTDQPTHNQNTMTDIASNDSKTKLRPRWGFLAFVVIYTIAVRVLPYALYRMGMDVEENFAIYPWNFTPMFAVCLFGGAVYRDRITALLLPIAMMFVGDLGIWAFSGKLDWAFHSDWYVIYAAMAFCAVLGFMLRDQKTVGRFTVAGIVGCLSFFLVTNFATWLGSTTYPQTWDGLATCYAAGLPFLRNSLLSTAIFGAILFSPMSVREVTTVSRREDGLAQVSAS